MLNFLLHKTTKCGITTPIMTKIAPAAFVNVMLSPRKIAAKIKPKGIINTKNKLAIPTVMFFKALL